LTRLIWIGFVFIAALLAVPAVAPTILRLINAAAWLLVVVGAVAIAWKITQYFTRR
jgi:hypothetical protein